MDIVHKPNSYAVFRAARAAKRKAPAQKEKRGRKTKGRKMT
jgi:hypothetical protein